jgi:hypothetical protein
MEKAWVAFCCSRSKVSMMAIFRRGDDAWELDEVQDSGPKTTMPPGQVSLTGAFALSTRYLGCPRCSADSFARCHQCSGLGCWQSTEPTYHCGWCAASGVVIPGLENVRALDAT